MHMKSVTGKVTATKTRDMITNSQPKHPRLPAFLSVEKEDTLKLIA